MTDHNYEIRGWVKSGESGETESTIRLMFETFHVDMEPNVAMEIAADMIAASIKTSTMANIHAALITADVDPKKLEALMQLAAATPGQLPDLIRILKRWGGPTDET
jgi:hypothetical protein